MVTASKIGGMLGAACAWMLFSWGARNIHPYLSDIVTHQIVLGVTSLLFFAIPFVIWGLKKAVPTSYLHGYEAAYQAEKTHAKIKSTKKLGLLSGLYLLLRYPYVLGIFSMVFFYETTITILSYLRLDVAQESAHSLSEYSAYLFQMVFWIHFVGFFISLIGTSYLMNIIGTKRCLVLIPILSGGCLFYVIYVGSGNSVVFAYIAFKAIYYAFSWPVRESLYIPTTKDIKFKSKSWIDAFGGKFAKTSGSAFNIIASHTTTATSIISSVHTSFFTIIMIAWLITSLLLGKRYEKAVANQEVIGS